MGDVDGDGILDMMIGAWGDDDGLTTFKCGQANNLIGKSAAAGAIYIAYRTPAGGANFSRMEKISNGRAGLLIFLFIFFVCWFSCFFRLQPSASAVFARFWFLISGVRNRRARSFSQPGIPRLTTHDGRGDTRKR